MTFIRNFAFAATLMAATPAFAGGSFSSSELADKCLATDDATQVGCLGYLGGVWDTLASSTSPLVCGSHVTLGEMRTLFLAQAAEYPHDSAAETAMSAFIHRYPCGNQ